MSFNRALKSSQGFTLIELMIVVGIIGILVAIAAPNFSKYQSKARQTEAKIALSAIYGAEKAFYAEYSSYAGSMDAIGYAPEGQKRFYNVGWAGVGGAVTGYAGSMNNASYNSVSNPYVCAASGSLNAALPADAQTFTVSAIGCIRQSAANDDQWNITDSKILSNSSINL